MPFAVSTRDEKRATVCFRRMENSHARPLPTDRENANLVDVAFGGGRDQWDAQAKGGASANVSKRDKGSKKEDIDAFLREATELVKVIHKYSATIERERAAASAVNPGDAADASGKDTAKLFGMMENMGITSALSEKQAGSAYHKQLARQLVDFLRHNDKLTKAGGMMTLTDVYCLFNRARGTNMISPEDLLKAVDMMKEMNLGISKRSFSSGVAVIQGDEFDDDTMGKKLAELASASMESRSRTDSPSPGGITVMDVCRALKTSALLANEQLLTAERMGLLCRDSTIEGVTFFPNLFDSGDFSSCLPYAC
jgi:ESCRT-II complex subunit VPS36